MHHNLVGRFNSEQSARRYVISLLAGFELSPDARRILDWHVHRRPQLIARSAANAQATIVAAIGHTVIVQTARDPDSVRQMSTMMWQLGGRVFCCDSRSAASIGLVAGIGPRDTTRLRWSELTCALARVGRFTRRGFVFYGVLETTGTEPSPSGLDAQLGRLAEICDAHGAVLAAEIDPNTQPDAVDTAVHSPLATRRERLWARFPSPEQAVATASAIDAKLTVAGRFMVVEGMPICPRLGWQVQRNGGTAHVIRGDEVRLELTLQQSNGSRAGSSAAGSSADRVAVELERCLAAGSTVRVSGGPGVLRGSIGTNQIGAAVVAAFEIARRHRLDLELEAMPIAPLPASLIRVAQEIRSVHARGTHREQTSDGSAGPVWSIRRPRSSITVAGRRLGS